MYTLEINNIIQNDIFYLVKVTLDTEEIFKISTRIIDKIAEKTNQTKYSISSLLATIKFIKRNTYFGIKDDKLDEDILINSLIILLRIYTAERLSDIFENLKYFEICDILESECPTKELKRKL